jgi:hypothetical protein
MLQFVGLLLTHTFGGAGRPMRAAPLLPVALGDVALGKSAQTNVTLDFSGCPVSARFSVNVLYVANGGSPGDALQLVSQFR